MKCGFLFAGVGGFEIAAKWMGWDLVWSNEIDPFCCEVLRKNFKHEIIEKDIREIMGRHKTNTPLNETDKNESGTLADVDILCGGFPC